MGQKREVMDTCSWKHWRQREWWQGRVTGSSSSDKQMGQVTSSSEGDAAGSAFPPVPPAMKCGMTLTWQDRM